MAQHTQLVLSLYAAIEAGRTGADLAAFFHPDAEQVEYPSLMRPRGHRRPLADVIAAADAGLSLLREQRYEVHSMLEDGDRAAVQLTWTAELATAAGGLPAGSRLLAHVAAFYEFRDGLVLRQSSYDCYEPLTG